MARTRKLIKLDQTYAYSFPDLDPVYLTGITTYNDVTYPVGAIDPEWEQEQFHIEIGQYEGATYYSVITDYTLTILRGNIPSDRVLSDYNISNVGFSTEVTEHFVSQRLGEYSVAELDRLGFFYGSSDAEAHKAGISSFISDSMKVGLEIEGVDDESVGVGTT